MAKRKHPMTVKQIEKRWATQQEKDRAEFLQNLNKLSDLQVFETYEEVCQSDDWDGTFTEMQSWKCKVTAEEMRRRLQWVEDERDRENYQVSESYEISEGC